MTSEIAERLATLEAEAKRLAQSPATRNGPEIHAVCHEAALLRVAALCPICRSAGEHSLSCPTRWYR